MPPQLPATITKNNKQNNTRSSAEEEGAGQLLQATPLASSGSGSAHPLPRAGDDVEARGKRLHGMLNSSGARGRSSEGYPRAPSRSKGERMRSRRP